jgi:diguanylate cyclase (GGDEF)-like protein
MARPRFRLATAKRSRGNAIALSERQTLSNRGVGWRSLAMTEMRDGPPAQRRRLLPAILGLGALSALAQALSGYPRSPVQMLGLVAAAGYFWSTLIALRNRQIAAGLRIGVAAVSLTYLGIQLGTVLFSRAIVPGSGSRLEAAVSWAPLALITVWFLFDETPSRRVAVIAYYLAVAAPEVIFGLARGPAAMLAAVDVTGPLLLASVALTIVLAEMTRLHDKFAAARAAQDVLARMAHTDALTELPNRRSLMADLAREAAVADRFGLPLAVIEFDLDHFKEINDAYGHQTGDRVLVAVARHVQGRLRATDVLGRLGGEEFLILAPGNSVAEATHLAEELCQSLRERPMAGDRAWVTGSFGVTVHESGDTADVILARADAALYAAKRDGRNRVATEVRSREGHSL